ncbi:universal stress protein [Pontixanthobacter gangjinensis]|uniref:Universal stress protein n=1 Tax=Christiangramia aestuarii TaxID=1028746 RepID=A0A7K1LPE3_9FLAO|nr:universal stress protein [Christiangramia aestuarii]MUP42646.1 universal stress protein [Christiangramia aestuarii]
MKRILLPTDFSDIAEYALKYAANLAEKYSAEIVALYMINREDAFLSRKEAMELYENIDYHKRINDSFKKFLDKDFLEGIKVSTEIKRQVEFEKITDLTDNLNVDLIVMGSHGAHGVGGMFIGSNAEKVIRTSEVPVLVVKKTQPFFKLKKVIMACDLNLDMVEAFKKAKKFLRDNSLDYEMVYVNTPEDFLSTGLMQTEVNKFFAEQGIREADIDDKVIFYNDFNIEAGIFNYADEVKADLIVLLTHGRKGLARLIYNSYGEKMANHSDIPVLTVKA